MCLTMILCKLCIVSVQTSRDDTFRQITLRAGASDHVLPQLSTHAPLQDAGPEVDPYSSCRVHISFQEAFSGYRPAGVSTAREIVWSLMHREMMSMTEANMLLKLEQQTTAEEFREQVGQWIASVARHCTNSRLCEALSQNILTPDEVACPTPHVLEQVEGQLEKWWLTEVLANKHSGAELMQTDRRNLTSAQLVLKQWGLRVLMPRLSAGSMNTPLPDAQQQTPDATLLRRHQFMESLSRLDALVGGLEVPDSDLLHLVREFLRAAEEQAQAVFLATGFPDNLLHLLRLLHEQRAQGTAGMLVREAILTDFYEVHIGELEDECAKLTRGGGGEGLGRAGKVGGAALARAWGPCRGRSGRASCLQARVKSLAAILRHFAEDRGTLLPREGGSLPAYWEGRIERVRRRLRDYRSGRGRRMSVLIWTCSFGGGHRAAAQAVKGYLPDYHIVVTDPTRDREYYESDALGDWIRHFIQPEWDETYLFNRLVLRHREYALEKALEYLQTFRGWLRGDGTRFDPPCPAPTCDNENKRLMRFALLRAAPDIVVTVYHIDLLPISELCRELGGLPLMHLSTDVDVKMQQVFGKTPADHGLHVGLPFDVPEAWPTIRPIAESQTFVSGYSVRSAFLRPLPAPAELHLERLRRGIPDGTRVALVMSGSEGQPVDWPVQLADSKSWDVPLHVVVVAAHNHDFGARLEGSLQASELPRGRTILLGSNRHVTVEVARNLLGSRGDAQGLYYLSEEEVCSLMDIADVLITKAGGSTVAEAAYRGLPTIFDAVAGMLSWEEFNARVFETHGRGIRMLNADDLERDLRRAFRLGRNRTLILDRVTGQAIDARQRIRREIARMLTDAAARQRNP